MSELQARNAAIDELAAEVEVLPVHSDCWAMTVEHIRDGLSVVGFQVSIETPGGARKVFPAVMRELTDPDEVSETYLRRVTDESKRLRKLRREKRRAAARAKPKASLITGENNG